MHPKPMGFSKESNSPFEDTEFEFLELNPKGWKQTVIANLGVHLVGLGGSTSQKTDTLS